MPPLSQNWSLAQCKYLALLVNQLHVCPDIARLGVRSSGLNGGFPLNVMYELGFSHFIGFYIF